MRYEADEDECLVVEKMLAYDLEAAVL